MFYAFPQNRVIEEIDKIRWISGVHRFPKNIAYMIPAISGSLEKLFFRGVLLNALLKEGLSFSLSLAIVTVLFVYGQITLTNTKIQVLVMAISSIIISIVGGLLFVATGSIVPPIIIHVSSAGFFAQPFKERTVKYQ